MSTMTERPGQRRNGWGEWVPTGRPGDDFYGAPPGIALNECAYPRPDPLGDAWLFVQSIDAHQRSVRERLERYAQQRRPK